jgi:MoaA/NifB/PqqE/SkfB family radical SAM enzyme
MLPRVHPAFGHGVRRLLSTSARLGIGSTRLYGLLSDVESKIRDRVCLEEMLEVLDASKPRVFQILRKHFKDSIEAQALTIKILNLCLANYHFLSRSTELLSSPFGLVVDPSNSCNLACPGCVHSQQVKALKLFDWKPGLVTENRVAAFLKQYGANATHATFCNYGEPLINPHTPDFIHLAKTYLLQTMVSTNISVLRFDPDAYAESGLDHMVLSIDGATQPVYERFRRKGNLELVFDNVRRLVEAKKRLGKLMPTLTWRFLAFEHNVHEIPIARERARELGVNQFEAVPAWDVSWDDPSIRAADIEPVNEYFDTDRRAAAIENWNPFPGRLAEDAIRREFDTTWKDKAAGRSSTVSQSGSTCQWLYKSITMDAGGRIFPCCCSPRPNADLNFAQFDSEGGSESFNSDKHQRSRRYFADPKAYIRGLDQDPYCVKCEWDKTADPSPAQIRNYFQAAGRKLFDYPSVDLLSSWG